VIWLWILLGTAGTLLAALALYLHIVIHRQYVPRLVRIFQEKPLFIIPRGQPVEDAESVTFRTADGLALRGCYLRARHRERRGVVLFGLEYGSNRWSCVPYCEALLADGFDVFAFEPRGQGESECQTGYEPLQWVTSYEVEDFRAALHYLKGRPDADARGIGFYGISKGGSAGLLAAWDDPWVRCFVTDGIFATHATMVPYMKKWVAIYSTRPWLLPLIPHWYYRHIARVGLRMARRERGCRFPHLETALPRLAPRPLFMIHGENDTYIKPEMARDLFELAREPREFWLVPGAKHNQALHLAGEEYRARVCDFFRTHLSAPDGHGVERAIGTPRKDVAPANAHEEVGTDLVGSAPSNLVR
jgi:pimeloyl-ACP methyl ester carboxylesterase